MNVCGESPIYMPEPPDCTDCETLLDSIEADITDALNQAKKYTDDELDAYVPKGTVTAPAVYVPYNTSNVAEVASVGSLPSLSTQYDAQNERLSLVWSAGSLPSSQNKSVMTSLGTAQASAPLFTGEVR